MGSEAKVASSGAFHCVESEEYTCSSLAKSIAQLSDIAWCFDRQLQTNRVTPAVLYCC